MGRWSPLLWMSETGQKYHVLHWNPYYQHISSSQRMLKWPLRWLRTNDELYQGHSSEHAQSQCSWRLRVCRWRWHFRNYVYILRFIPSSLLQQARWSYGSTKLTVPEHKSFWNVWSWYTAFVFIWYDCLQAQIFSNKMYKQSPVTSDIWLYY